MQYKVQGSMTPEKFKADIKLKQSQGKKVMISLGGGGQHFALATQEGKQNFIKTVEDICTEFGFNGIDIDFETSSLELDPGRYGLQASDDAFDREPDRCAARDSRPLRADLHAEPGAGRIADSGGVSGLRRPVRLVHSDPPGHPRHARLYGYAGLQLPARSKDWTASSTCRARWTITLQRRSCCCTAST